MKTPRPPALTIRGNQTLYENIADNRVAVAEFLFKNRTNPKRFYVMGDCFFVDPELFDLTWRQVKAAWQLNSAVPVPGWTYALTRLGRHFDLIKIGHTWRSPVERARMAIVEHYHFQYFPKDGRKLYQECRDGHPEVWAVRSAFPSKIEALAHDALHPYRQIPEFCSAPWRKKPKRSPVAHIKEAFRVDLPVALGALHNASGIRPERFKL